MIIRLEKPTLRRKDMDAVLQTMADEHIGPGEHSARFVNALKANTGIGGAAVALRSLPEALHVALSLAGVERGDTVAVSALSPRMYRQVADRIGCSLALYDIDPDSGNLSFEQVAEATKTPIKAVLLYEPAGNIPLNTEWRELGVPVLEDITESFGSGEGDVRAGWIGDIVVCAFEESSVVSTGGGAAVLCKDPELASALGSLTAAVLPYIELSDMNAALGVVQLHHMEANLERRRMVFDRYRQALMRTRHQLFGIRDIDYRSNGHSFTVVLDTKPSEAEQFAFRHEVATARAFPDTLIATETDRFDRYPNAIPCVLRSMRFPLYPFLTNQQILQIEKVISHLP